MGSDKKKENQLSVCNKIFFFLFSVSVGFVCVCSAQTQTTTKQKKKLTKNEKKIATSRKGSISIPQIAENKEKNKTYFETITSRMGHVCSFAVPPLCNF